MCSRYMTFNYVHIIVISYSITDFKQQLEIAGIEFLHAGVDNSLTLSK